jgi:hypothetical protein
MLHASTRKLIDRLAEMTELNKLDWTESDAGQIIYSTEGYSVSLTEEPNELVITSKDGKELERANAEELAATQNDDGVAYTAIVGAMTAEAARIARGTEAAISSLLAGMEEHTAEPEVAAIQETPSEEELTEDQVDDTNIVDADSIETVAAPLEESENENSETAETDGEEAEPDTAEIEAEAAIEPTEEIQAETDQDEVTQVDDDVVAAMATAEEIPEADAETESDVTEAVARLADEVNQREDSTLDAAAASAVGAVALAAGLTTTDVAEEPEIHEPETAPELAAAPLSDPEPTKYVPFGLEESAAEDAPEAAPVLAEAPEAVEDVASKSVEETSASFSTMDTFTSDEVDSAETEVSSGEPFEFGSTEPEQTDTEDIVSETVVPFAAFTPETGEETPETAEAKETQDVGETVTQIAAEDAAPVSETETDLTPDELEEAPSFTEAVDLYTAPEPDPAPETVAPFGITEPTEVEPVAASTQEVADPEPAAPEAAPAQTIAIETPITSAPQSYSLSGIGAGFGLGALSAKTEASGVPGPSAAAEPEKVVIDATEDVLPEIDGKPALPEGLSAAAEPPTSSEAAPAEAESNAEESDILKPRTRFNPWD